MYGCLQAIIHSNSIVIILILSYGAPFIYIQDCSCSTLIAEKFALTAPEILTGQGFSRLLVLGVTYL
jgi:hypothetical protein